MKKIFLAFAIFTSSAVVAQKNSSTEQRINDDGKKLSITIKGTVDGKKIDYSEAYDITGLSEKQKDALVHRVYDSLGVAYPIPPKPPVAPAPPAPPVAPKPPAEPVALELKAPVAPGDEPVVIARSEFDESMAVGGNRPFTREINYNPQSGLLYMKYKFLKNNEEVTYEKSVDAKNSTKEERTEMVKKYQVEIGLSKR